MRHPALDEGTGGRGEAAFPEVDEARRVNEPNSGFQNLEQKVVVGELLARLLKSDRAQVLDRRLVGHP